MNLISIGRFTQNFNYETNIQNYTTWRAMSEYFDSIFLIVESPNAESHYENVGKLFIYWIPCKNSGLTGRLAFMKEAYKLSKQLIMEKNISVVNISEPIISGPVAVMLKKKLHIPLVTQIQGQLLDLPKGVFSKIKTAFIYHITRYVCKHSDRIRTVSQEISRSIIEIGIPQNRIYTIPPRCDVNKFDPAKFTTIRTEMRSMFGYTPDDIVLVFTGRLVAYRDLESDMIALSELLQLNKSYKLLVVGDGEDREYLEQKAYSLGVSENTHFTGKVAFDDVPKYLSIGDIFISTPTNEGIARSVLEAMSMELPVVATRVGGTPEVIKHGENGILVDTKSPKQIVEAVLFISSTYEKRIEMGKKARDTIIQSYEFNKLIKCFAEMHFGM